ncbi:Uncharacterised protein [uncultured archaeon]|nr:Uncharacterised protein [uncultured archaeon]
MHIGDRGYVVNSAQLLLQRTKSLSVNGGCIQSHAVEQSYLLLYTAILRGCVVGGHLHKHAHALFGSVVHDIDIAVPALVRRHRVVFEPFSVGVTIEVVTGMNLKIHVAQVESRKLLRWRGIGRSQTRHLDQWYQRYEHNYAKNHLRPGSN